MAQDKSGGNRRSTALRSSRSNRFVLWFRLRDGAATFVRGLKGDIRPSCSNVAGESSSTHALSFGKAANNGLISDENATPLPTFMKYKGLIPKWSRAAQYSPLSESAT